MSKDDIEQPTFSEVLTCLSRSLNFRLCRTCYSRTTSSNMMLLKYYTKTNHSGSYQSIFRYGNSYCQSFIYISVTFTKWYYGHTCHHFYWSHKIESKDLPSFSKELKYKMACTRLLQYYISNPISFQYFAKNLFAFGSKRPSTITYHC